MSKYVEKYRHMGIIGGVLFDKETNAWFVETINASSVLCIQQEDRKRLRQDFENLIQDFLSICLEYNMEPTNEINTIH